MGIYLNPGIENYLESLNSEIYVDKSMLIAEMNRLINGNGKYVCISRPRRFGKTIASNMLAAYYGKNLDSGELFRTLDVYQDASFMEHLNRYNVISIDINSEYSNSIDNSSFLIELQMCISEELIELYPHVTLRARDGVAKNITKIYNKTGDQFILIIDEYDALVRKEADKTLFEEYLKFLEGLFKSNTVRPAIALAYLTGILPIVRDKIQSKLNNFDEYTILNARRLAQYVGFTSDEVEFLCKKYGLDYHECKRWYNGYSQHGFDIYNPKSVVMAVENHFLDNYWGRTSSYEVISDQIKANFAGTKEDVVKMMAGEKVPVDTYTYLNTMDQFSSKYDVFTYLIHVGYLAYDYETKTCRIPNWEILQEWIRALAKINDYSVTDKIIQDSRELLEATFSLDEDAVSKALDESHIHVTSNRSYNNEDALQSAIYLAYIYALNEYTVVRETTSGLGFADVVYIPIKSKDPAMVIELKRNGSAESAINQIKQKKYFDCLSNYEGNLLFVGINYDEKKKTHTCQIEKFVK